MLQPWFFLPAYVHTEEYSTVSEVPQPVMQHPMFFCEAYVQVANQPFVRSSVMLQGDPQVRCLYQCEILQVHDSSAWSGKICSPKPLAHTGSLAVFVEAGFFVPDWVSSSLAILSHLFSGQKV